MMKATMLALNGIRAKAFKEGALFAIQQMSKILRDKTDLNHKYLEKNISDKVWEEMVPEETENRYNTDA